MKHLIASTRPETRAEAADRPGGDKRANKPSPESLAPGDRAPHMEPMVQITRDELAEEFSCPHCGTSYAVNWGAPARDSGSARCETCDKIMKTWDDSPIPRFKIKERADDPQPDERRVHGRSYATRPAAPKAAG
jgi:predicted Zn finger-like uncharacterized protein